jgi:hypothetical protein
MLRLGAQLETSTVAARLTGLLLTNDARSHPHTICAIFPVVLTFIQDIEVFRLLVISYHILSMTCKVMEAYKGEHLSNVLVYEFQHITTTGRMCVFKDSFSELG